MQWLSEINKYARENVSKLLVGNKSDLAIGEGRQVRFEAAKEFADKNRMPFLETSSKSASNVETAFLTMVRPHARALPPKAAERELPRGWARGAPSARVASATLTACTRDRTLAHHRAQATEIKNRMESQAMPSEGPKDKVSLNRNNKTKESSGCC